MSSPFYDSQKVKTWFTVIGFIYILTIIGFVMFYKSSIEVSYTIQLPSDQEMVMNNIEAAHIPFELNDFNHLNTQGYEIGDFYGYSMQPTLFEGNKVIQMPVPDNYVIKAGDIIRFKHPNTQNYTIHRVKGNYRDMIITSGDNNANSVERIQRENVTHVIVGVLFT